MKIKKLYEDVENNNDSIDLDDASKKEIKDAIIKDFRAEYEEYVKAHPGEKVVAFNTDKEQLDAKLNSDVDAIYRFSGKIDDLSGVGADGFEQQLARSYSQSMSAYYLWWKKLKYAQEQGDEKAVEYLMTHRNKYDKLDANGRNILVWGLPGFGKTAEVDAFCEEHHLKRVDVKLSGMPNEFITGIPFPMIGPGGAYIQANVTDPKWNNIINHPDIPVVLFFDEVTRADLEKQNLAFGVINEKVIETTRKEPTYFSLESGRIIPGEVTKGEMYLNNILFSVFACNPGTRLFGGSGEVDNALINRWGSAWERKGNVEAFKKVLVNAYNSQIAEIQADFAKYGESEPTNIINTLRGRRRIAEWILSDSGFHFDGWDDQEQITAHNKKFLGTGPHWFQNSANQAVARGNTSAKDAETANKNSGWGVGLNAGDRQLWTNLSYRSFTSALGNCNGTKADFIGSVTRKANEDGALLKPDTASMLVSILNKGYKDDFSPNAAYNSNTATAKEKAAEKKAQNAIDDAADDFA